MGDDGITDQKQGSWVPSSENSHRSPYFIVIGGGTPGAILPLSPEGTSLGRFPENQLQILESSISRRHAHFHVDKRGRSMLTDLGTTNGTFVNGEPLPPRIPREIKDNDLIQFGSALMVKFVWLDQYEYTFHQDMYRRAVRDPLTGLYKRDHFIEQMNMLIMRNTNRQIGTAAMVLDLDFFKRINDTYLHQVGDRVLRAVAEVLESEVVQEELAGRYGGEEFVFALPAVDLNEAYQRAERIRLKIADLLFQVPGQTRHPVQFRVTTSIGVSFAAFGERQTSAGLIADADQCLLIAKRQGRNRVVPNLRPIGSTLVRGSGVIDPSLVTDRCSDTLDEAHFNNEKTTSSAWHAGVPVVGGRDAGTSVINIFHHAPQPDELPRTPRNDPLFESSMKNVVVSTNALTNRALPSSATESPMTSSSPAPAVNPAQWRIGVCSWSLQVSSIAQLQDLMRRLNCEFVQIACGDPHHASWEEGDELPERARSAGLTLLGAMLGFPGEDYTTPQTIKRTGGFGDPSTRAERLQRLEWALDRTRRFGLSDLMLHAGFIPPLGDPARAGFLDTLRRAADLAGAAGITLAFETGQEPAELLRQTLDELDSPWLKVNFDPANMLLYDMGNPIEAVRLLGPDIRSVHLKDARRPQTPGQWGEETPLGQGEVPFPEFLQTLVEVGFDGPLFVEREVGDREQRFQDIRHALDYVRRLIENNLAPPHPV